MYPRAADLGALAEDGAPAPAPKHIVTVDFARGIFAFAVMAYHLLARQQIVEIERVAYYAVYGFFVISGFSLYITYRDRIETSRQAVAYFVRRFFRIAPLFYTVLIVRMLTDPLPGPVYAFYLFVLNATFTFGVANPAGTSLVNGGWSIGIEMVFYLVFPAFVAITAKSLARVVATACTALLIMILFVNATLRGHAEMDWAASTGYTQPIAFFGYFAFGMATGEILLRYPRWKGSFLGLTSIALGLVPFILVRTESNLGLLINGAGLMLMAGTLAIAGGAAFVREPTGMLKTLAVWLGALSYPVYLIHTPVYNGVAKLMTGWPCVLVTALLTVLASAAVSRFIERPARQFGARYASSLLDAGGNQDGQDNRVFPSSDPRPYSDSASQAR
jgi:peptidoglycan/LPS O-acetylase OafA/YrhL